MHVGGHTKHANADILTQYLGKGLDILWKPKTKRYHSENEQHRVPKSHRRLYKIYASAATLGQIIKTKQKQRNRKRERDREREGITRNEAK